MKVLVTGGTGFTGSHLVRRLLDRGHEVRVLDNAPGLFHDELREAGAEIHLGSVADRELVRRMAAGCEVVHHLAAAFRKINLPKSEYWQVNVEGTRHIAEACIDHGVRKLVYCSTQGVHGDVKQSPGNEESPIAPEDYYQYTKYEGERVLVDYFAKGLDATVIRPTAIYGPGDPGRFLILFREAAKGHFYMFGNGQTHYHPVYIDNLVDSFELAAETPRARGRTYLIADEKYYTLEDLVRAVGVAIDVPVKIIKLPFRPLWLAALACEGVCLPFGVEPPLFRRRVDWFRQNRAFSIARARAELGYEPRVDLATGLAATGRWYRDNKYLDR
jgi:nucleoside-diphosphate-sugar epimerase